MKNTCQIILQRWDYGGNNPKRKQKIQHKRIMDLDIIQSQNYHLKFMFKFSVQNYWLWSRIYSNVYLYFFCSNLTQNWDIPISKCGIITSFLEFFTPLLFSHFLFPFPSHYYLTPFITISVWSYLSYKLESRLFLKVKKQRKCKYSLFLEAQKTVVLSSAFD